jgi:uncharacterized repeat protein (TIGR01451 family)
VRGNDGVSTYPSTVVSGSPVQDSGGTSYTFTPGHYQFPRLAPGTYRIDVEPPQGYRFPSAAVDTGLKGLPGGPYATGTGSHGEPFKLVQGPALELDIPVDPGPLGELNILKAAGKATVGVGDFVPYTLQIGNRGALALPNVVIADRVPVGFRYHKGSARLGNAALADPQVSADGRSLQFALGALAGDASVVLRYVLQVAAGAQPGRGEHGAGHGRIASNVAKAYVQVRDDLNASRAIPWGRVTRGRVLRRRRARARRRCRAWRTCACCCKTAPSIAHRRGRQLARGQHPPRHPRRAGRHHHAAQGLELKNCDPPAAPAAASSRSSSTSAPAPCGAPTSGWCARPAACASQVQRQASARRPAAVRAGREPSRVRHRHAAGRRAGDAGSVQLDGQPLARRRSRTTACCRAPAGPARPLADHVFAFETDGAADAELKAWCACSRWASRRVAAAAGAAGARGRGRHSARRCRWARLSRGSASHGEARRAGRDAHAAARSCPTTTSGWPPRARQRVAAPAGGFSPALPVIKVAVKHAKGSHARTEGERQPGRSRCATRAPSCSPTGEWALSQLARGRPARRRQPDRADVRDAEGAVLLQESRVIHYSTRRSRVDARPRSVRAWWPTAARSRWSPCACSIAKASRRGAASPASSS